MSSVLFIPFIACIALGFIGGAIGSIVVLKRQSLLGETLSHACYPGLALGLWIYPDSLTVTLISGLVFSFLAYWSIQVLTKKIRVSTDAALCVVLASYFALGLLFISGVQNEAPTLVKKLHALLLGQAATISEQYAIASVIAFVVVSLLIFTLFRSIKGELFDPVFSVLIGVSTGSARYIISALVVITLILGAKMMGVVLMSSLLIFPAVTVRAWVSSFSRMLIASSFLGAFASGLGLYFSDRVSMAYEGLSIPTGPAISVFLAFFFFISYLFAPNVGLLVKMYKRMGFKDRCNQENLLKAIWKMEESTGRKGFLISEVAYSTALKKETVVTLTQKLKGHGYLTISHQEVALNEKGRAAAQKLVRLHRLWELYLVEFCNMAKERVHPSAEDMEHILTPEIERELESLLQHPTTDPHKQPIPYQNGGVS